jgi:hypothetical protein
MADQNITALPAVTTPESSDQLLLVGATEEKLIDYDKLADAILGKIASKNFALDQGNKTLLQALNELNSNKVSYAKYEIINPAKEFSLTLDNASIYLVCYAGIDTDNVKNIGFSVVVSRSSSSTKGGVLNIKSEIPQATLSLKENVLKCTPTVWLRIFVIKL